MKITENIKENKDAINAILTALMLAAIVVIPWTTLCVSKRQFETQTAITESIMEKSEERFREQLETQKTYNELSVKPYPAPYVRMSRGELSVEFENRGLGAMIMESFIFRLDNVLKKDVKEFLNTNYSDYFDHTQNALSNTSIIGKDEKIIIFGLKQRLFNNDAENVLNDTKKILNEIELVMTYSGLYGKSYTATLDWKGRVK